MPDDAVLPAWIESAGRKTEMVSNAITVPFALATLILGAVNLNNCPVQPWIPKYLIIHAGFMLASVLLWLYVQRKKHQARANTYEETKVVRAMRSIILVAGLVLLCFGVYWTFGANPTFDDTLKPTYCNFWTYFVAYASFLLFFFVIFVTFCLTCGIACYQVCIKDGGASEESKSDMSEDVAMPEWAESAVRKAELVMNAVSIPLAVGTLILGLSNLDYCPAQPMIPKYLIVHSLLTLIYVPLAFYVEFKKRKTSPNKYEQPTILRAASIIITSMGFVLLILGMYWTFGASPTFNDPFQTTYCHFWTYFATFATFQFIFFIIIVAISLIFGIACHQACKKINVEMIEEAKRERA